MRANELGQCGSMCSPPGLASPTVRRAVPFLLHTRVIVDLRSHRRGDNLVGHAKKKGKKGGQKKGPGSLMDIPKADKPQEETALEPWQSTDVIMNNLLVVESFSRNVGRPLLEGEVELTDIAQELWEAPFALLSHEQPEEGSEPVFTYANRAALELFEAEWGELVGKPSSMSADADAQEDRSQALGKALEGGKLEGYSGWRRSLKGTRFRVLEATLFNVSSPTGEVLGQAAKIGQWSFEDGRIEGPDAEPGATVPSPEDIATAEKAVEEQAGEVRILKEAKGLTNSDPAVKAAVDELLQRKERLQQMQERLAAAEDAPASQ